MIQPWSMHYLTTIKTAISSPTYSRAPTMENRGIPFIAISPKEEAFTPWIEYFTNGMHKLQEEDYQVLSKCKRVHFTISIDGYGTMNETVRSGSVWSRVVKTLDEIADVFDYTIHSVVHKNNWHGLPELAEFAKNYKKWTTNVLTFPKELDIINLEQCDKTELEKILDAYDIPNRQYIKAHLQGDA